MNEENSTTSEHKGREMSSASHRRSQAVPTVDADGGARRPARLGWVGDRFYSAMQGSLL